jgi:hypothetical protein
MRMKYDEEEKCNYDEKKLTFIHYVITAISHYRISLFSPFFSVNFFKDEVEISFDPPKIENREKFLLFLNKIAREVVKYENENK